MFNFLNKLPKSFIKKPLALRGFHDCNGSFTKGSGPENSRESILHAINNGLGIEIDVRFTKDYVPIVIHDDYLKRLCGVDNYLSNYNYNEIKLLKLNNNESLPTLSEVLSIVNGKAPILIEFKKLNKTQEQKFFKNELYSLLKKLPNIQRGLVLEKYDYIKKIYSSYDENVITENQMQKNGISFVSFEYSKLTKEFYNINKTKKRNVIAWTINSKLEAIKMKNCCDTITFEGFKPI